MIFVHYKLVGVEEQALDGIVMITGPILNNVPLRCVCSFFGIFSLHSRLFLYQPFIMRTFSLLGHLPSVMKFQLTHFHSFSLFIIFLLRRLLFFFCPHLFGNYLSIRSIFCPKVSCWQFSYFCWWKAVCYLNSYGRDFKGGLFHFQDGEPATIEPLAGVSEPLYVFYGIFLQYLHW